MLQVSLEKAPPSPCLNLPSPRLPLEPEFLPQGTLPSPRLRDEMSWALHKRGSCYISRLLHCYISHLLLCYTATYPICYIATYPICQRETATLAISGLHLVSFLTLVKFQQQICNSAQCHWESAFHLMAFLVTSFNLSSKSTILIDANCVNVFRF